MYAYIANHEIDIHLEHAELASHSGDCEQEVKYLLGLPYLANQLIEIDIDSLKEHLRDYGAWDDSELQDYTANLERALWIACNDIVELYTYRGDE
jgi:hypothetical protein